MKNRLIQNYNQKLISFFESFVKTIENQNDKDVHQLRVSIKNLKIILSFIETASNHEFRKRNHFILFSKLFRRAGEIREIQVNLGLIDRHNSAYLKPYLKYGRKIQKKTGRKLFLEMRAFNFNKLEKLNKRLLKKMDKLSYKIVTKELILYVLRRLKKINKLKDQPHNNNRLHQIRLHFKAAAEILSIMKGLNLTTELAAVHSDVKLLNKLIGKWHDYTILRASLKNFVKHGTNKKENRLLREEIKYIKYKNKIRRKKIGKLLKEYDFQQF